MILVFRCYKYKEMTVYVNGIVESEKTGNRIVIWGNIRRKEGDSFKATPESEFELTAKLVE